MTRPLISVVTPCLNEETNIGLCVDAVRKVFAALPRYDYEHIICDNASTDRTGEILESLATNDHRIKVIFNARNFGPIHSLHNGLLSAAGDAVFVCLPADLQDPPELIPQFLEKWEEGNEVVYGVRKRREEPWFMRTLRKIHYRLVSKLSEVDVPVDAGLYQLIDRSVLNAIRQCPDQYPFIPGMIAHCGFQRAAVEYTWRKRQHSVSKATWFNMADQTMNALTSFSRIPLRAAFFASGATLAISAALAFVACLQSLRSASSVGWWIGTAVLFLAGLQLGFVGVLGEYIASIHRQVRPRPIVVERRRLNFESAESSSEAQAPGANRRVWSRDAA